MTLQQLRHLFSPVKRMTRQSGRAILSQAMRSKMGRRLLNPLYNRLAWSAKEQFHTLCSAELYYSRRPVAPGKWRVGFAGHSINVQIASATAGFDLDVALGLLAHDAPVKQTYQWLVESGQIKTAFDIGANVGTHTLLLLACGLHVVSFEPNPNCWTFIERICEANRLKPNVVRVALSDHVGEIELSFPADKLWLGTIEKDTARFLLDDNLRCVTVPLTTLDAYCEATKTLPDLIKIDTEGAELAVLQGARLTIQKSRPIIIFEANLGSNRVALADAINNFGYGIYDLPLTGSQRSLCKDFLTSRHVNFAALTSPYKEES